MKVRRRLTTFSLLTYGIQKIKRNKDFWNPRRQVADEIHGKVSRLTNIAPPVFFNFFKKLGNNYEPILIKP